MGDRLIDDIQKNTVAGTLAVVYHANGMCNTKDENIGPYLTDYWRENVTDRQPPRVGVAARPPLSNEPFLKMMKRCIRLRTRSLHAPYQNARMDLLRRVINGQYDSLSEMQDFRVQVLSRSGVQKPKMTLQFMEDLSTIEVPVNDFPSYLGDISAAVGAPLNTPVMIQLVVAIATQRQRKGAWEGNMALVKDLSHTRELIKWKRTYLLAKYCPVGVVRKFRDVDISTSFRRRPKWANSIQVQRTWLGTLVAMLLRLISLRKENDDQDEIREQLWDIHRHLHALMNERGVEMEIVVKRENEVAGVVDAKEKLSTISYPYYTRKTFNKRLNGDDITRVIFETIVQPPGNPRFANQIERWKKACSLPYKDPDNRTEIHAEYFDATTPEGLDVDLPGSYPVGTQAGVPVGATAVAVAAGAHQVAAGQINYPANDFYAKVSNDTNTRILPGMVRSMMMQLDLFSDDTWGFMREQYPDDFDPAFMHKCDSVAGTGADEDRPLFDRPNTVMSEGLNDAPIPYPKIQKARAESISTCSKSLEEINTVIAMLKNVYDFFYHFAEGATITGFDVQNYDGPFGGTLEEHLDFIRTPDPTAGAAPNKWYLKIHPQCFAGFYDMVGGQRVNYDHTRLMNDLYTTPFEKLNNKSMQTVITQIQALPFVNPNPIQNQQPPYRLEQCKLLRRHADYAEIVFKRMRAFGTDSADVLAIGGGGRQHSAVFRIEDVFADILLHGPENLVELDITALPPATKNMYIRGYDNILELAKLVAKHQRDELQPILDSLQI